MRHLRHVSSTQLIDGVDLESSSLNMTSCCKLKGATTAPVKAAQPCAPDKVDGGKGNAMQATQPAAICSNWCSHGNQQAPCSCRTCQRQTGLQTPKLHGSSGPMLSFDKRLAAAPALCRRKCNNKIDGPNKTLDSLRQLLLTKHG